MKLCFFLKDSQEVIAPCKGNIRVTRKTRVRKQKRDKKNILTWNLQEEMTTAKLEASQEAGQAITVPTSSYVKSDIEPEEPKKRECD